MIGKLIGKIDSTFEDYVIINVNGVGYLVFCGTNNIAKLPVGILAEILIETHVREDRIHLFGFLSLEEKKTFSLLQNVNGIGPRLALCILSHFSPAQLRESLLYKDKEAFKSIPGVGAKLAERMLIELKDKLDSFAGDLLTINSPKTPESEIKSDAISALSNLGIDRLTAINTVNNLINADPAIKLDQLIKLALKNPIK